MWNLALASAFFLCIHLMISGTILKQQIITAIGQRFYMLLFTIFSIVGLIWMIGSYYSALVDFQNIHFWPNLKWTNWAMFPMNFIAWNIMCIGILSPSPTSLKSATKMAEKPVVGIVRITRHPFLAGFGLLCLAHMVSNADLASWIFFGSLMSLCVLGAHSIDQKRLETYGEFYERIIRRTSILPFAALMGGKVSFEPQEIGVLRLALSVSSFAVIEVLHELFFLKPAL